MLVTMFRREGAHTHIMSETQFLRGTLTNFSGVHRNDDGVLKGGKERDLSLGILAVYFLE